VPVPRSVALAEGSAAIVNDLSDQPLSVPPRILGDLGPRDSGPVFICFCVVHGNEPAGLLAIQRLVARLQSTGVELAGRFVGVIGNAQAYAAGKRFLEIDLNRAFQPERLERLRRDGAEPLCPEEAELVALDELLREAQSLAAGRPVFLLDLHSTSGGGAPFSVLDDTLKNRAFAFHIPVPHVLGLEEELVGTVTSQANRMGLVAMAFEAGQHDDPESIDRAEAAILIALEASGVLPPGQLDAKGARQLLASATSGLPRVVEVRRRHALAQGHQFRMEPGFHNFDAIRRGQLLATDGGEPVAADRNARLLMPLYQGQGDDGFFIVHDVKPIWLELSAWLRGLPLHGLLHWLPGVRRHSQRPETLIVDKHRARWLALQVFHLLGYRRRRGKNRTLVMTRRDRG